MKRKDGFTLIELLAVIVILAIIAVIATPIIVGIIEDSRKAAFERSVEGIIHATDLDFGTQETLSNDTYTIENGVVDKTLKAPVKNIEGFSGTIKYDDKGNSTYAIYNDKWCMKKTSEGITTQEYVNGECILVESSDSEILTTINNLVPNENDVVTSGTGQLINLGEFGIRFQGQNPNNYVEFSGDTWRIIGIVDGKIKLIKASSLETELAWDSSEVKKDWGNSSLQKYLNSDYYELLSDKEMIDESTWHLRSYTTTSGIDKYEMYGIERGTGSVGGYIVYDLASIERKVGIMYPSDYGFAAKTIDTCTDTSELYNYGVCKNSNWIANTQTNNYEWTITVDSVYQGYAIHISSDGVVYANYGIVNAFGVRPTVYLKSNVKITGDGDGSEMNKYQLIME